MSLIFLTPASYFTRQGADSPVKKLEAILMEQQDHRVFAAHSSLGWSAGEPGAFEIKKPFLKCENAPPTTMEEPQPLKGTQAAEKCAAVSPGKAPSVIKTNAPPTQKPAAKVKAPAPPKTRAESWQPWRSTASVLMAAFLIAVSCSVFGLVDATSLASAGGTQPALYVNSSPPGWTVRHVAPGYPSPSPSPSPSPKP